MVKTFFNIFLGMRGNGKWKESVAGGGGKLHNFWELDTADFGALVDVNIVTTMRMTHMVMPQLLLRVQSQAE